MAALVEGDLLQITVHGIASGQAINNVLWYDVDSIVGGVDLSSVPAAFALLWEAVVLPGLSDSYTVQQYVARKFRGLYVPPSTPPEPLRILMRFADVSFVAGGVLDVGAIAGAALPTYVAAGYKRFSGGPADTKYVPDLHMDISRPLEKTFRSSFRIGPLAEAYTEVAAQNDLTAAAITVLEDVGEDLMSFNVTVGANIANLDQVIPSTVIEGLPRANGQGIANIPYSIAYQIVEGAVLNPRVTSQVSRKQRAAGA